MKVYNSNHLPILIRVNVGFSRKMGNPNVFILTFVPSVSEDKRKHHGGTKIRL